MTKKDYIRAAALISQMHVTESVREEIITTFVMFFSPDNPNFREVEFCAACAYAMKR